MIQEENFTSVPKVSVIIPVFNAERYIQQCLDSVLSQSLKDIEIICVDDGSTDTSLDILNRYKERDSRIIVIHQENLHAGIARNRGMDQAVGEYIHFLDADDWLANEDVYKRWYDIAKYEKADVCVCQLNRYYTKTNALEKRISNLSNLKNYVERISMELQPEKVIFCSCVPWNKIYRRKFLLENNIRFDNLICANDRYFYIQVALTVKRMFVIKEWWINHRKDVDGALTGELRLRNYDCHFKSFFNIWEIAKNRSDEVKNLILRASFTDFLFFYQKSKDTPYEDSIRERLYNFFQKWDISDIIADLGKQDVVCYLEIIKDFGQEPILNSLLKIYENNISSEHRNLQEKQNEHNQMVEQYNQVIKKYNQVVNSKSYKLGRFLSFPYRKVKGAINCYQEHGCAYTAKRCWKKLTGNK